MARPQHLPAILAYLQEHGETRMAEVGLGCNLAPGTLYSAVTGAIERGEILKRNEGRSVFYRLPEQEPALRQPAAADGEKSAPEPTGEFQAAAWADGDVDLYGLIELEDGGYRLTSEMVAKLKRLITWMPVGAAA